MWIKLYLGACEQTTTHQFPATDLSWDELSLSSPTATAHLFFHLLLLSGHQGKKNWDVVKKLRNNERRQSQVYFDDTEGIIKEDKATPWAAIFLYQARDLQELGSSEEHGLKHCLLQNSNSSRKRITLVSKTRESRTTNMLVTSVKTVLFLTKFTWEMTAICLDSHQLFHHIQILQN